MERKKIILLASSDINYDQRVQKIAASLHQLNAEVCVLGRKLPSSVSLMQKPFHQKRLSCFFNNGVLFYLELNLRFFFHLISNSYDTVCANDPDTLLAATTAKVFKNFELVYDSHEYFTEVPELHGRSLKKKIWGIIERHGVHKAAVRYTVNESLATILGGKYKREFHVLRNVPNLRTLPISAKNEKYLLYQGALNEGRGLRELIQAMPQIPINLKIAGKGDLEEDLKRLVLNLKLESKVEFLGNLLPEKLREVTNSAFIGINLLEGESLNYYYSLANKFFDYMHAVVPSLNMKFPEYESILSKWEVGLALQNLSSKEIAQAVNLLLNDNKLYITLQSNCKAAKELYHWQLEEMKLKEIYKL